MTRPPRPPAGQELRVGIAGAGWAGRRHAEAVAAAGGARVVAVADADPGRARALAGPLGAAVHADAAALAREPGLDLLVVATPPAAHREPAEAALDRGTAVLVEKPLARTPGDARAIADASRRSGAVCAVGYQWRALGLLEAVRGLLGPRPLALLVSQGIGTTAAREWFLDPAQSGRLFSERASHHIDLQCALAGEVAGVQAVAGAVALSGHPLAARGLEEVVSVALRFASGAVGAVHVAWIAEDEPGRHGLSLVGPGALLDVALDPQFTVEGHVDGRPVRAGGPEQAMELQMARCLDAVRAGDPAAVPCTPAQGVHSLEVALAAERAAATGAAVAVGPP